MLFVVFFCSIVVLIGILDSIGVLKRGVEFAFGLIILISAIRYNFGADYMNYLYTFNEVSNFPDFSYLFRLVDGPFDRYEGVELGWMVLNRLFKPFGFAALLTFTSLFTNIVYYKFIKTYVPRTWYWLALFVYMFDTNLFFVPLSMMRQSFAMVLFVFSYRYIAQRRILPAIATILIAALFHKSALVLLPFVFLGYLEKVNGRVVVVSFLSMVIVLMLTKDLTMNIVRSALAIPSFESFGDYFLKMEAADAFGLGFLSRVMTLFVPFLFYYPDTNQDFKKRLTVLVACVSFLIAPFTLIMGFLGRIDYYFGIYNIVAIPLLYNWIKKRYLKIGLLVVYIAYTLYSYNQFFKIPDWVTFTHYQTIFG